ncbi:molybdopterin-guanine dinucleotide biosynthesis protein B [Phyllobacterium sp. 628]|uniref:molybdopterin-guanine dinucleotide biosynthesis protein B n=1 Tax=Phyllobacterium sp. 628 TaxID=2718938 RepID=UPI0016624504|nr:molybdopterin-guanine dinucleotide biosynthesis protein B [Phyllobacterium sp. 628]QND53414.1 molybdopterin-guanine dinucleotide biosynthesis protein B [Phyllobacterium sp. 628]
MTHRIFGITGWKNSGKTTLTVKLVTELIRRGWKISTIKHAHHDFDIDKEGTDSWRHRKAGAGEVAIVSDHRWALMHELADENEPSLDEIIARFSPCDLVLVEGYKREGHKKIETRRRDGRAGDPLAPHDPTIVAVASDFTIEDSAIPVFDLNDVDGLADLIEREMNLGH